MPGLADQTVAGVIAWLPELGRISNEAAGALLGAAPYDDDSGGRKGQRHIKGGRRKLRNLLYMPIMGAATQHNPVLKAYYQRLRARGKEAKDPHRQPAQADRHPEHDAARDRPGTRRLEPPHERGFARPPGGARADRMHAKKPSERTGSRPKPPKAGAQSASLEPSRAPGYPDHHSCSPPLRGSGDRQGVVNDALWHGGEGGAV